MKNNFLRYIFLSCLGLVLLSSCRKDEYATKETGNSGKSFIKITEGKFRAQFFAPFDDVKSVTMFTVRKTAANNADLQKANNIVLTDLGQSYVTQYNKDNKSDYELLPANMYTLAKDASIVASGNKLTFKFAPGDFAKNYTLNIDGSKFDPSTKYMVAFVISDPSGLTINAGKDTIVSTISLKNKYDGVYEVTGSYADLANPGFTGYFPYKAELETISANEVDVFNATLGNYGFLFNLNDGSGQQSYYGSFAPEFTFDPATNKVISVVNAYGQLSGGNKRSADLDPTGVNEFDPVSRTIKVKYNMSHNVNGHVIRAVFDETYTFKEERE